MAHCRIIRFRFARASTGKSHFFALAATGRSTEMLELFDCFLFYASLPLQGDKMIVTEDGTEAELIAMQHIEEPQQPQQIQHQQPIKQIVQTASGKQQTLYSCKVLC